MIFVDVPNRPEGSAARWGAINPTAIQLFNSIFESYDMLVLGYMRTTGFKSKLLLLCQVEAFIYFYFVYDAYFYIIQYHSLVTLRLSRPYL